MLRDEISYITNALSLDWQPDDPVNPNPAIEGKIPIEKLPLLLHELTHSQCFLGIVGETFGYLWRLILSASKVPEIANQIEEKTVPFDFLRLLQNCAAGIKVYEPWAEGLALFAEWDGLPGDSPAASKAMVHASSLYFMTSKFQTEKAAWETFSNDLKRARLLSAARQRKTNLLSVGLSEANGHYLAGYLGVKALYRSALSRSPRFLDRDLFCSFAALVLFHDPVAATILLDVDTPFSEWLVGVQERLSERLTWFEVADLDARVQMHEVASVTGGMITPELVAKTDAAPLPNDIESAVTRYERIRREMHPVTKGNNEAAGVSEKAWSEQFDKHIELLVRFTPKAAKDTGAAHREILRSALKHRAMIRLRRISGVAIAGATDVTLVDADGKVVARVDKGPHVPTGFSHDGATYAFYFYPQLRCFMRVMYVMFEPGPKYLGVTAYGMMPLGKENVAVLRDAIMHNERLEYIRRSPGAEDEVWQVVDRCLSEEEEKQARASALAIALAPLLGHLSPPKRTELVARMSSFGIFGWLGRTSTIVEGATLLSLLSSEGIASKEVRRRLTDEGVAWEAVAESLRSFSETHNVRLQWEQDIEGEGKLISVF